MHCVSIPKDINDKGKCNSLFQDGLRFQMQCTFNCLQQFKCSIQREEEPLLKGRQYTEYKPDKFKETMKN